MKAEPVDNDTLPAEVRVSVWSLKPGGITGSYLGDGVLTSKDFVVLHPRAAQAAIEAGPPPRLRVVVETPWARYVTNGSVMQPAEPAGRLLIAVELDWPITEDPNPMPPAHDADGLTALEAWLADAEAACPSDEPYRPKRTGYTRKPRPRHVSNGNAAAAAAKEPWWCTVWPGCWGCK
ncbi:MAG: hypothetical protein Q4G51_01265 [Dermatophilus congolensis]|nr:hypothetical protein [Dermatophilus congolensis]